MKLNAKIKLITWAICLGLFLFNSLTAQAQRKKDKKEEKKMQLSPDQAQAEAEYYFIEGMKFFSLENYPKALDSFEKARGYIEKAPSIDFKIAETQASLNNIYEAEIYAKKALDEDKTNPYFYILLARIYEEQAKFDLAAQTYQKMLDAKIASPEYYYDLANIYERNNDYNKAISTFEQLEKEYGTDEQITRRKQQIYLQLGQADKAIKEGEKLLASEPQDPRHAVSLSEILIANNQTDAALSILEDAAKQESLDPRVYLLLAKIYREKGEVSKSLTQLKIAFANPELPADDKVKTLLLYIQEDENKTTNNDYIELSKQIIKTQPNSDAGYVLYGDMLVRQGEKEQAKQQYLKATRLNPDIHPKIWQQVLAIESEISAYDSLAKHAEDALEVYPNQALFWLYLGMAQLGEKKYTPAIEALEEGKRMAFNQEDLKLDFMAMLGDAYQGMGQYTESNASYDEALKIMPNHERTLNNYSYFLALRKENLPKAEEMAERLVENHPENGTYLDTYGWVLYAQKEYKKARKILEKALQYTQGGAVIEHYGDVLFKLGETEEAIEQWQKAQKQGGTSPNLDKKISNKKLYE